MAKKRCPMSDAALGLLIKAKREKIGMTQEAFAFQLGVSRVTLNRWENGQTIPKSALIIQRIREILDGKRKLK